MTDGSKCWATTNGGSTLQRALHAATPRERNDGQVGEGAQRAAKVVPPLCRLTANREVGDEEPGERQEHGRPGRDQQGHRDATEAEKRKNARHEQQPDKRARELLGEMLLWRALKDSEV